MIIANKDGTSELFRELSDAVDALAGDRKVVLCAHDSPGDIPKGAVVYNLENIPLQLATDMFQGYELWDFSVRNCEAWRADGREVTHVPVGYHPSMERFEMLPWGDRTTDVVFSGLMNNRRWELVNALIDRGLKVDVIYPGPGCYGAERDARLAKAKLAIAPLFYPDGVYSTLRAAHCVANKLPLVSEIAPDMPSWIGPSLQYEAMADFIVRVLSEGEATLSAFAEASYRAFKAHPMTLPEPKPSPWRHVRKPANEWDLEAMYAEERGGPVSDEPCVRFIVPSYRELYEIGLKTEPSRDAVTSDLISHGIHVQRAAINGDSLPTRMRQRAAHWALKSEATHFLWWDLDIEALDPSCVRKMLESGHDVVAGACPFRDWSGRTVHNLWPGTEAQWQNDGQVKMYKGCVEVMDAGTGFMLVSRRALIRLQYAHPELLHWSRGREDWGEPLWSLYREGIFEEPGTGDPVSKSEDYHFCRLWQGLGEKVYVYAPARFRHYGTHGFEGSFLEQYGMEQRRAG